MERSDQCLFQEPWQGQCRETRVNGSLCCKEHSESKCAVCGDQAMTRCQASIGLMCGVPLCDYCGHSQMCLDHATRGPLVVIRGLLGGGPVLSIFSTAETYAADQAAMDVQVERLKRRKFKRYDLQAEQAVP